jgi:outer membrane lipase/esterase
MKKLLAAGAALAALVSAAPALAQSATSLGRVIVFGDSFSDAGNLPAATGLPIQPPPYVGFRSSNGPVWAEQVGALIGGSNPRNLNFAVSGAFSGNGNIVAAGQPAPIAAALAQTGTRQQVQRYLAGGTRFQRNDVAVLWAGPNDYFAFLPTVNPATAQAQVAAQVGVTVGNLTASMNDLTAAGARQLLIWGVPSLGDTPQLGGPVTGALAEFITVSHNQALAAAAAGVANRTGAQIYQVDLYSFAKAVGANPQRFGFTNATASCIATPSCISGTIAQQNQFTFFDGVHPTTAAHARIAEFVADSVLAPRTLAANGEVAALTALDFQSDLEGIVRDAASTAPDEIRLFASVGGGASERTGELDALGYETETVRGTVGIVSRLTPDLVFTGAVALDETSVDLMMNKGAADQTGLRVGAGLGWGKGPWSLQAALSANFSGIDIARRTGLAGAVVTGETTATTFVASAEAARAFALGESVRLTPFLALRHADGKVDAFGESGFVGLDQSVAESDVSSSQAELGARLGGGSAGFGWNLALSWVEGSELDQSIGSALTTVPDLVRRMRVDGPDMSHGRIGGDIRWSLGAFGVLSAEARGTLDRADGDAWSAALRWRYGL